nr:MAG TPA: hypothetical protein [Caudoviricetes sp.]
MILLCKFAHYCAGKKVTVYLTTYYVWGNFVTYNHCAWLQQNLRRLVMKNMFDEFDGF